MHALQVILWIGAVGVLALAFMKVGNWISRRVDTEHVTSAWLIAPVGGPMQMTGTGRPCGGGLPPPP